MEKRPGKDEERRNPRGERFLRWGAYGFALVLPFVMFFWIAPFVGDDTIGHDYAMYPTPHQMELQYSIEHGSWPLNAPGFAGGRPAAALTLGQMYHPISHLSALVPGYWEGKALDINTALRLLLLGLTQLALLVALGRVRLRLDLSFVLSFITVYNMRALDLFRFGASLENFTGHLLLCAVMVIYFLRPTRVVGPLLLIGSAYLLVVGGHPQMMYFGLIASGVFALAVPFVLPSVVGQPVDLKGALRFWGVITACVAAAILLAAAYVAPLYFDFVAETGARVERAYQWSLLNCDTWGGALNSFFEPLNVSVTGAFGGSGLIVIILVFPVMALARMRIPRGVVLLVVLLALLFAVSLGRATPLHRLFWEYVPLASSFRVPGRITMLFPALFLLVLLWLMKDGDRKVEVWGRTLPVSVQTVVALCALMLHAVYNLWLHQEVPAPGFPLSYRFREIPDWVFPTVFWLGSGTLALAAAHGVRWRGRGVVGALLVFAVLAQTWVVLQHGTWIVDKRDTPTLEAMDRQKADSLGFRGPPGNMLQSDLVDRKMRYSFVDYQTAGFYRNHISVKDRDAAYRAMAVERDAHTVVVEGFEGASVTGVGYGKGDVDRVELVEASFNRIVFEVSAGADGFLDFTSLDTGRWKAAVDGKDARVFIANGGEQAVRLDAGDHRVEFRFESPSSTAGMIVSLVTLGLIGAFFAFRYGKSPARIAVIVTAVIIPTALFVAWSSSLYSGDNLGTEYRWSSLQLPPEGNLAYGRPTRMSSIYRNQMPFPYLSSRAVDGDRVTTAFRTRDRRKGQWWQVDLGARHRIGEVVVYDGRGAGSKNHLPLKVLVSDDGKKFSLAKKVEDRGSRRPWRIDLGGAVGRYVRIKASGARLLSFREVEIYEATPVEDAGEDR